MPQIIFKFYAYFSRNAYNRILGPVNYLHNFKVASCSLNYIFLIMNIITQYQKWKLGDLHCGHNALVYFVSVVNRLKLLTLA